MAAYADTCPENRSAEAKDSIMIPHHQGSCQDCNLLDTIESPDDLRGFNLRELEQLAEEIITYAAASLSR